MVRMGKYRISEKQRCVKSAVPRINFPHDIQLSEYAVVHVTSPRSWRLMSLDDADTEASFRIQGVLCAFELPPVRR
jgi:hypothetical protein